MSTRLLEPGVVECSCSCRFTNIQKQLLAPFVVYADFESILQRVGDEAMDTTQGVAADGDEPTPAAGPFQNHLPCSFAYKLVSSVVPDFSRPLASYMAEDAGEMFLRELQEEAEQLVQEYYPTTANSSGNSTLSKDWYRVRSW